MSHPTREALQKFSHATLVEFLAINANRFYLSEIEIIDYTLRSIYAQRELHTALAETQSAASGSAEWWRAQNRFDNAMAALDSLNPPSPPTMVESGEP